jgi:phosphohistidine phosphatase
MKTIYLCRHAKSSWDYSNLRDIERPLNERGLRDAPFMARLFREKGIKPDAIFTSPAVRALTTATYFKNELDMVGKHFQVLDILYEASSQEIYHLIQTLSDDFQVVMIFGHNPAFTSAANLFSKGYIENIPTCGIVRIDTEVSQWRLFAYETANVTEFYSPKQYL